MIWRKKKVGKVEDYLLSRMVRKGMGGGEPCKYLEKNNSRGKKETRT